MRLLTAFGLSAALFVAGCGEPVASTAPIFVPDPLPSVSFTVPSFATPNEVKPQACEKIRTLLSTAFGAEVDWREKRLSDEEFEEVLRVINEELNWGGYEKDSNGFWFPAMASVALTFYAPAIRDLGEAHLSLRAVISVGVNDYRFVKAHLKEAKTLSTAWMDNYCADAN